MKYKIGDLVKLKSKTRLVMTKEAHEGYACVKGEEYDNGSKLMDIEWLGKAKGVQNDGGYYVTDFVPYLNGLELAVRKAKEL